MRARGLASFLAPLLLSCAPSGPAQGPKEVAEDSADDADGDGFVGEEDCAEGDASIHAGAAEICDAVDNNCDGLIDEGVLEEWYEDADGDGFGDPLSTTEACDLPLGHASNGNDCDDTSELVYPGAAEICDGLDNDCDGTVDDDELISWYADADADGHGDPEQVVEACAQPEGHVAAGDDCDDAAGEAHPGAAELCDELDNDCDRDVDEGVGETWYEDRDADGYGDGAATVEACAPPEGYASEPGDCDDADDRYHPGAEEADCADPSDYNCDGGVGYADADADGWAACEDCDDRDPDILPTAAEVCDGLDNDCDSFVDDVDPNLDRSTTSSWYEDDDGDGYGDPDDSLQACAAPAGHVADSSDCDDRFDSIHPGAPEICNDTDDDCDLLIDDEDSDLLASSASAWHPDDDGDGHGDPSSSLLACEAPAGYRSTGDDCDDAAAAVHPGADELCGGVDEDCDGLLDDADPELLRSSTSAWYPDGDGDGHGAAAPVHQSCLPPAGHSSSSGDCDDAAADTYPGAQERCGGGDEDCDGLIDDADLSADLSTGLTAYPDADGDGYGTSPRLACDLPAGHALLGGDCDEGDAAVNPAASERCDGLDNDCDGLTDDDDPTLAASSRSTWYADVDEDGHGDSARSSESCLAPSGFISTAGDCDDGDEDIHPSAQERCDGLDNDCDTLIDDADSSLLASSRSDWYPDLDGDGYGLSSGATAACAAPVGHAALGGDCDDDDSDVHPGAMELCGGADEDCDALVDDADPGVDLSSASSWFADEDLDGDGDPRSTVQACAEGVGRVDNDDDCDDRDPAQGPCGSCQEVLDGGLSSGDGLYELDPCGTGLPRSYWCDMSHDGGGWTLAGWQSASATTMLGHADRGTVGSSDWSMDLSCVAYDQVAVFNLTHGQFYSQSYSASTWTAATGNQAIGPAGTAFKQGTYGPSASQIVMGCVDYTYGGGTYAQYACDNDSTRGQRGHIADYAGEFCSGGRLDYTWAWTDGSSCTLRGSPYTWGIAIR